MGTVPGQPWRGVAGYFRRVAEGTPRNYREIPGPRLRVGELMDAAFHSIALAVALHRVDCVVVCRLRLKAVHAHPENRIGMILV